MAFDPDAYLAAAPKKAGFDPDAYLGKKADPPSTLTDFEKRTIAKESTGTGSALTAGASRAVDSLTMGIPVLDYASSGVNYLADKARGGKTDFAHELEYTRALRKATEEANKGAAITGDVVGTAGSFLMPGGLIAKGAGKLIEGSSAVAKLAGKAGSKFPGLEKLIGNVGGQAIEGAAVSGTGGALQGAGTEEGAISGGIKGMALGGTLGGAVPLAFAAAKPVMKGAVSALTGRNIGVVDQYYGNLEKLATAKEPFAAGEALGQALSKVSDDLKITGGREAAEVLAKSGHTVPIEKLKELVGAPFDEAMKRAGKDSDTRALAGAKDDFMREIDKRFGAKIESPEKVSKVLGADGRPVVIPAVVRPGEPVPATFLRHEVHSLQDMANFNGGKNSLVEGAAGSGQHNVNEYLKTTIPEYDKVMDAQAIRASALGTFNMHPKMNPVTGKYEYSPDSLNAVLKSVSSEKPTAGNLQKIQRLADAMPPGQGAKLIEDAKLSYLKHAFDTQNPNGSRNVNAWANVGSGAGKFVGSLIPGAGQTASETLGKVGGTIMGYGADKFAAPAAAKAMKLAKGIEAKWGALPPESKAKIQAAIARGPAELILMHSELLKRDPAYAEATREL